MPETENMFELQDSQEDESDLSTDSSQTAEEAIVNATDWTIETILSQVNKGNIILNPTFQRRDAWRPQRKSEFIESIFLGLPVPQIVLASHKERKGKYIVIDGKQRLLSLRQFSSKETETEFEKLKLTGLKVKKDLNGKNLHDLQNDLHFHEDVNGFENETIRTVVIKHWPNEEFLYRVFLRLNTGSVGLSPQELRQALHPGPFVDFADITSQDSAAIKEMLRITQPDFRMRDVEILIRYYAFRYFIHSYTGSMKTFLDKTCETLNAEWPSKEKEIWLAGSDLVNAHQLTKTIFSDNAYRKWTGHKYETRFNRAIFDIMAFFFVKPDVITAISGQEQKIENAFKKLCQEDQMFLASIERTTKSIESTCYRLAAWAKTLNEILGTSLPVFTVQNERIV